MLSKCYVTQALLEFFQMVGAEHRQTAIGPHSVYDLTEKYRKAYIVDVLNKFLYEFVFNNVGKRILDENVSDEDVSDGVLRCRINISMFRLEHRNWFFFFQENWNCEVNKLIRFIGTNKTDKAISEARCF